MSTLDAPSQLDSTPDLWHVRLPSGEVRTMSLDELDTAFQDGHVDEETLVCQAGAAQWSPLRELAGLDDAPTARHSNNAQNVAPQTPAPFAVDVPSVRPVAADLDLDIPPDGFRPTINRKAVVAVAISLGVLLGVVLAITKADGTPDPAVAAAGVGVTVDSTLPPIVAAPKAPDPPAATATPPTPPGTADVTAPGARLSSDQRKALLGVDKAHAQQHKARSAPSHAASRSNSKPVFHKGGSKGDPLNSSI